MNMKKNLIKTLLCIVVALSVTACDKKKTEEIPLANVTKGTFYIDLYEEGEIEAVNSVNISAPNISWRYGNLKITHIINDGEEVKAGDTLVVFDPSEVQKGIVDAESRLEISEAELEKLIAQHESELEELNADLEVTQISQEISKINFEVAVYESEMKKKEIELNLEKAEIALEKAKEQINNRTKIQKEEIKQKKLSINQDVIRLEEAHETLRKLSVTTPSPGLAIIAHHWPTNSKFQAGDQCYSGMSLILLPDLSSLKVTVNINEVDIAKIKKGLNVEVKPDAFSDSIFTGKVISVANLAVNKDGSSKIKVFPVEILLDRVSKNLLPGLTVSCRLLIKKIEDVISIPLVALFTEGDKSFVYKKTTVGYDKVEVETGERNSDYIIITKGLNEKDKVALTNPFLDKEADSKTSQEKEL
ncbi:HlyD family secretion protein [Dysgonomonadaceae bacterium PH5-43]|nr:HlyD family secretion protein [Dysgonomonadaceae bacterium PH5-43]